MLTTAGEFLNLRSVEQTNPKRQRGRTLQTTLKPEYSEAPALAHASG